MSAKLSLTALAAALLLASAVGHASAGRLSSSNQNLRLTFSSLEFGSESVTIRCPITLEGSFHSRTIAKIARALVGSVTKAAIKQEACVNGKGGAFNGVERYNGTTTPNSLPWHLTYESFAGTLPNITSLQMLVSGFRTGIEAAGVCNAQYGTATDNITLSATREASGGITGLAPVATQNTINLFRRDSGIACPATGTMTGTGTVMLLGATTRISITLI